MEIKLENNNLNICGTNESELAAVMRVLQQIERSGVKEMTLKEFKDLLNLNSRIYKDAIITNIGIGKNE